MHDKQKLGECVSKGSFDSTVESHEEILEEVSIFSESLINISPENPTLPNLEDKVSNYLTSKSFFLTLLFGLKNYLAKLFLQLYSLTAMV